MAWGQQVISGDLEGVGDEGKALRQDGLFVVLQARDNLIGAAGKRGEGLLGEPEFTTAQEDAEANGTRRRVLR